METIAKSLKKPLKTITRVTFYGGGGSRGASPPIEKSPECWFSLPLIEKQGKPLRNQNQWKTIGIYSQNNEKALKCNGDHWNRLKIIEKQWDPLFSAFFYNFAEIRRPESGLRSLGNAGGGIPYSGIWILDAGFGFRIPKSGIRNLKSGIRNPESGIRNSEIINR